MSAANASAVRPFSPVCLHATVDILSCSILVPDHSSGCRLCRTGSLPAAAVTRAATGAPQLSPQQPVAAAPSSGGSAPASEQRQRRPSAQPLWLEQRLALAWQLWALLSGGASGGRKRRLLRRKRLLQQKSLACWSPCCRTQSCRQRQMPGFLMMRKQVQQAAARLPVARSLPATPPAQPSESSSRRAAAGGQRATNGQQLHLQLQLSLLQVPSGSAPHLGQRQRRQQQLGR